MTATDAKDDRDRRYSDSKILKAPYAEKDKMNEALNKNNEVFLSGRGGKDSARNIGDFFYDLKPARDAGVGLTEETIDYIVDVKEEQ
jgi:hypothetical protein